MKTTRSAVSSLIVGVSKRSISKRCINNGQQHQHCRQSTRRSTTTTTSLQYLHDLRNQGVLTPGFQPTAYTSTDLYVGSTHLAVAPKTLPILNVSAILDPKTFCRRGGNNNNNGTTTTAATASNNNNNKSTKNSNYEISLNGTEAAKRLVRGRKQFTLILQRQLMEQDVCHLFSMRGHGVPHQLFNHLLKQADLLLGDQGHQVEIHSSSSLSDATSSMWPMTNPLFSSSSFKDATTHDSHNNNNNNNNSSLLSHSIMSYSTTDNQGTPYQFPTLHHNQHDVLELWIVAMHRMTQHLNFVMSPDGATAGKLLQWRALVGRHAIIPPSLIESPEPIVEWIPSEDGKKNEGGRLGQISITLQQSPVLAMRFLAEYEYYPLGLPPSIGGFKYSSLNMI